MPEAPGTDDFGRPDLCTSRDEIDEEAMVIQSFKARAALAVVAAPFVGCASAEIVPQVPTQDGVAVVEASQLQLRAELARES